MKRPRSAVVLAAAMLCAATAIPAAAQSLFTSWFSPSTGGYTQTKYPVVLVHGILGFDTFVGLEYFWGIPGALRSGGADVITIQVSAMNSTQVRGEQLLKALQKLQATKGYTKFNLIGHSHGGPTSRYVAGVAPHMVASVTSIGSPHAGSVTADTLQAAGLLPFGGPLFTAFAQVIGLLSGNDGLPQDGYAGLYAQTSAGAAAFTSRFPQGKPTYACGTGPELVGGVRYYSYGGASVVTNLFDFGDPVLAATSVPFGFARNDGVVSPCSSRWGTVIRSDMPWNHMDQVNGFFGLRSFFAPDPPTVYRTHVNRLKSAGL